MTSRGRPDAAEAARTASSVVELLEVLWGGGRLASTAPVSPSQLRLMLVLEQKGTSNLRYLSEMLEAAPSSTSRLCDRLQAVGFVIRRPSASSGRETLLELSPEGRTYLADLRRRRETELAAVLAHVPPRQRAAMIEGLEAFRNAAALLLPHTDGNPGFAVNTA